MWRDDEVACERIASDVSAGLFFLAESAGEVVGTLKFQCSDTVFGPTFHRMSPHLFIAWRCVFGFARLGCRARKRAGPSLPAAGL
jgi:hypothetical protein